MWAERMDDQNNAVPVTKICCCTTSMPRSFSAMFSSLFQGTSSAQGHSSPSISTVSKSTNQVCPTPMPTVEQPKERQKSLERLNGWSEAEIMQWEPDEYEKDLVKRTWSDDFDFLYELGAAIYTYIFEHNPQAKMLFTKIHRHGDNWKQSSDFRSQALKFVQTLSYAAKNLYHMESYLQPRLVQIGEAHVKYAARGFKPEYWDIFLDAMEFALTNHISAISGFDERQRTDATRVWRQLAHYIISNHIHETGLFGAGGEGSTAAEGRPKRTRVN